MSFYTTIESPIGELLLVGSELGLSGLYMEWESIEPARDGLGSREPKRFEREREELSEYFAGKRLKFTLRLAPVGTPFQLAVWQQLARIPFGETRSYADVANAVGSPRAVRAVGGANGRNPIGIVVPCHRVIAADGSMGGFSAGLPRKRWLLDWEQRVLETHGKTPRKSRQMELLSPR